MLFFIYRRRIVNPPWANLALHLCRRRHFLHLATTGLIASLATNCQPSATSPPQGGGQPRLSNSSGFDWRRFAGTEITLLLDDHPWTTGIRPYLAEFEALTGIALNIRIVPEPEYFAEIETTLRSDPVQADAFFLPMDSTAYRLWRENLLLPLMPLIHDLSLTASDYNLFDFPEGFRLTAMYPPNQPNFDLFGIPATFETYVLFYNKRWVNQFLAGRVPQTMAELVEAATQINASGQTSGMVMRGVASETIIDTVSGIVLNSWGTDPTPLPFGLWFDGDWRRPRLNDPRIVAGLATYAQLMRAGPPHIKQMDWAEAIQRFQAGKAAFFIDASLFGPDLEGAEAAAIAGDVGYTVLPRVSDQSLTGHWLWGLGIPQKSAHPEAAWLFIQWATSSTMEAKIAVATGGAPAFHLAQSLGLHRSDEPRLCPDGTNGDENLAPHGGVPSPVEPGCPGHRGGYSSDL